MPRHFLKKFMPKPHEIKEHRVLSLFGNILHEPNLWHMNRRSVAGAFMVGLFFAWWPVPMQMLLAAGGAIVLRTNLPLSVALVWISNPLTMGPMFYFAYLLGTWVIGVPEKAFSIEPTLEWLMNEMLLIWKPFLTGCAIMAITSSVIGYFAMSYIWTHSVLSRRAQRKAGKSQP